MVYSGHLSGLLSINSEYTHASRVEPANCLLCSPKWFAEYQFQINTHSSWMESVNGLLYSPKLFAQYQFQIHTFLRCGNRARCVKSNRINGLLCSPKWFSHYDCGILTWLKGGNEIRCEKTQQQMVYSVGLSSLLSINFSYM